eukprot:gb/GECG01012758.1/.p1 GENE.gb/GECG01012758.1/~~gb/GECG01012758.1/.p1  ORF type:complete len:122 (+),score=11.85 gb/GECG01012758.1/:1-366(+)
MGQNLRSHFTRNSLESVMLHKRILSKGGEVNKLSELMILSEDLELLQFQSADLTDSWRKITLATAGTGHTGEEWNVVPDVSTTAMAGECVTGQTLKCVTVSTHFDGREIDARLAVVDQMPG